MKREIIPFIEYFAEAATACLVTMVQGNMLVVTAAHLIIASQTGLIAGAIAALGLYFARANTRLVISMTLGVITTVVDYLVHPGMFGSAVTEAVVTGVGAAILSYLIGTAMQYFRSRKAI